MKRIPRRTLTWAVLFVAVTVVLVTLLVLIGLGYLTLPKSAPAQITISEVEWTVVQGTTSHGIGWFGPSNFNYSHNAGYPRSQTVGTTFGLPWTPENFDTMSHTIYSFTVGNAGWSLVSSHPALPDSVPPGDDGGQFDFMISVPNGASGTVVLDVTVNALS
ncbi:MAG: hypothetical protein WB947_00825 [Thermoplasmata archaeon]